MDNILKWLMNYCYDHGIGVVYGNDLPPTAPSDSWCNPKLVIFNDNFHHPNEKPFMMAHEIGHVVEGNPEYYKLAYLGKVRGEYSANIFAINLLKEYCLDNDIWYENIYDFAKAFGIPTKYYYLLDDSSAVTLNLHIVEA